MLCGRGDCMKLNENLPMGLGFALMQNEKARARFDGMSSAQQKDIVTRSGAVSSKREMKSFVDSI